MKPEGLDPAARELLLEACRLADRLDTLDDSLRNRTVWLDLFEDRESGEVFLVVDKLLSEARQHALALKQVLAELRAARAPSARSTPVEPVSPGKGVGSVTDIAARIAERLGNSAG